MAVLSNTGILAGASAAGGDGHKVEKSLMFDSSQSKYLSWEPTDTSTAADPTTGVRNFTISFWAKVDGSLAGTNSWCAAGASSQINGILQFYIEYGKITINCYNAYMQSTRKLADPAAWYHIVLAVDTDQAEPIDRFKVWVNNERITEWTSSTLTYPYRGHPILWNTDVPHQIGAMRNASSANSSFGNYHLAEFYNIDGQTLDPSYFGELNSNGKWVPKEYEGTYGLQVDNSEDWSGNNDPTDAPLSSSGGSWDSAASTAEQLFTYDPSIGGNVYAGGVGQALTWEPASQYTFTDKVEIRTTSFNGAAHAQEATLTYSDLTTTSTTFTDWGWTTIATGGGTIKKIEMQAGAGDYNYWNAIRIDGKVLIDSAHSTVTDNGFYLKFSGNAKVYSDDIEGTEYDQTWYTKDMMFDGDTATSYLAWNGNDVIWTPSGGLAFDSTLRIETGDGDIVFNWDGGSYTLTTSGGKTWYDVSSNVQSPITSVTWTCSSLGSGPYVYRVEVDGEVLINHNDIETDSSGNDNHVKAHNLATTSGQIYSSGSTVGTVSNPWTYAFDGLPGDGAYTYSNSSATITLPSPKDWNSKFEVYILYYGGTLEVNGSDVGSSNISSGGTTPTWYDITSIVGSSGTLTSIGVSDTPTGWYVSLRAIRLDGEVLIDGPGDADLVLDSPTDFSNDGQGVGNYCTWNPLLLTSSIDTLTKGNLEAAHTVGSGWTGSLTSTFCGTIGVTSGKWYFEVKLGSASLPSIGITPTVRGEYYVGYAGNGIGYASGALYNSDWLMPSTPATPSSLTTGDVIGVAVDMDNGFVWFSKNGDWENSGDPTDTDAASNGAYGTGFVGETMYPAVSQVNSGDGLEVMANFGQRPFAYTPPTGFKALNTYNLPTPTIKDPSKHFNTVIYEGDPGQTNEVTGVGFEPDLVWIKNLDNANNHGLFDQVRGDTKLIYASLTSTEDTISDFSFTSDGFTTDSTDNTYNNSFTYVSWNWDSASTDEVKAAGALNTSLYNQAGWVAATTATNINSGSTLSDIMNGQDGGSFHGGGTSPLILEWSSGTISGNVRLKLRTYGTAAHTYKVAGDATDHSITVPTLSTFDWYDLGNIDLVEYKGTCPSSGNAAAIEAIELDGKILVDTGQTPTSVPTIETTYRANPEAGFSIINYTGTDTAGTVLHGLNAAPNFVIAKNREAANDWVVYHSDLNSLHTLYLNGNGLQGSDATIWPGEHNSNTVRIGSAGIHNALGQEQLMYAWSEVAGYSKFGKYDGTAVADPGPAYVYCGFRPAWIMVKNRDAAEDWFIWDSKRDGYNPIYQHLEIYSADVQNANTNDGVIDILSNGFKIRSQYSPNNANTYVFAAFAESPFKYANAR